jgi:V8-like Glu-specific endopeptidase
VTPSVLKEVVGVFWNADGTPFCTGYRSGVNTVLTARHCFYEKDTNHLRTPIAYFSYPGGGSTKHQVCGETASKIKNSDPSFSDLDDYIEVTVAGPAVAPPAIKRLNGPLQQGTDLLLLGAFPVVGLLKPHDPMQTLRMSSAGGCVAYEVSGGCVFDGCQTQPGSSGAPIFAKVSNELLFVGLHIQGSNESSACKPKAYRGSMFNVGIFPAQ